MVSEPFYQRMWLFPSSGDVCIAEPLITEVLYFIHLLYWWGLVQWRYLQRYSDGDRIILVIIITIIIEPLLCDRQLAKHLSLTVIL